MSENFLPYFCPERQEATITQPNPDNNNSPLTHQNLNNFMPPFDPARREVLNRQPIPDNNSPALPQMGGPGAALENPMSLMGPHLACQNPASADKSPVYIITDSSAEVTHRLEPVIVALLSPYGLFGRRTRNLAEPLVHEFNRLVRGGQRLFGCEKRRSWVIAIDQNTVVKIRAGIDMDHISNLDYIKKHAPGLPVPSFLGALRSGIFSYIFLSRPRGETLESAWPSLTEADKAAVQSQLSDYMRHLRRMRPLNAPVFLGSFSSRFCKFLREGDPLSADDMYNEDMLNAFLCSHGRSEIESNLVLRSMRYDHHLVLTWGDLQPRNIMIERNEVAAVGGSISITALLHWNLAGWYPEHWEATRAIYLAGSPGAIKDWIKYLPWDALGDYPVEYSMDLALRHCLVKRTGCEKSTEREREGQR